ncbi:MAG TPA: tetratricopeptide repeat protein [Candidatus Krumholzibacteria bacterium]|nr:tetratricopeptide repeat protein [Candidatus Krumholzibacteria bacterium]
MNEKVTSAQQKASQERKRGQHAKALKRLEQTIAQFPEELELYLDAIDISLESGEVTAATHFLKTAQDRFAKDKDRLTAFVREKLTAVHDPAFARFVVENSVKLRDLTAGLDHLQVIPDHTVRDLLARTRTKKQTLKSASHGGYSLRGELLTNELMSALLSLRVGNVKEAVAAIVQILDEKPVEQAILTPFLAALNGAHAKSGRVRFAHACAQCASGAELEGIGGFVEAARMEPAVAALCADRLKILRETSKARAKTLRALGEVLLIKGDFDDACDVLGEYLKTEKDTGREVVLLVRPYMDPNGVNACTWLALNAALTVDQSSAALDILRPLQQRGDCSTELLAWFETHATGVELTNDMKLVHALCSVDCKRHERAAAIFAEVCEASAADIPAVVGMLDRVRTQHAALDELYRRYAGGRDELDTEISDDTPSEEDDFQMFDNREFELPASGTAAAPATPANGAGPARAARGFADQMKKTIRKGSFVDTREISFDDDAGDAPGEAPAHALGDEISMDRAAPMEIGHGAAMPGATAAQPPRPSSTVPTEMPAFSLGGGNEPAAAAGTPAAPANFVHQPAPPTQAAAPITEEHVHNVAQKLYEAGAAAFFHVDSSTTTTADAPRETAAPAGGADGPADVPATAADEDTPPAEPTFDELLAVYRNGGLDNAAIISLMGQAVNAARVDALQELLYFEPQHPSEDFSRRYYQAEYLLLRDRPLPALKLLTRLDLPPLTDEQKQQLWSRMAACQRMIRDYAAANETLTRLVDAFPSREDYAHLARVNYDQYLAEQCQETAVLEKTSSLD